MDLKTTADYSYTQYWAGVYGQDHVIMRIQACSDAHILLSYAAEDMSNVYEIALGTKSKNMNNLLCFTYTLMYVIGDSKTSTNRYVLLLAQLLRSLLFYDIILVLVYCVKLREHIYSYPLSS